MEMKGHVSNSVCVDTHTRTHALEWSFIGCHYSDLDRVLISDPTLLGDEIHHVA